MNARGRLETLQDALAHAVDRFAFWASDGQNSDQAEAWASIAFAIGVHLPGDQQEHTHV